MKFLILFFIISGIRDILKKEIEKNFKYLNENFEIKPYFILYRIFDIKIYYLEFSDKNLVEERKTNLRIPYVELRVGDYKNDGVNTKILTDFLEDEDFKNFLYPKLPLEDDEHGIRDVFWKITDFAYKISVRNFYEKEKKGTVFLEEDTSYSFSKEIPNKYIEKRREKINYEEIRNKFFEFNKKIKKEKFIYNLKTYFYSINMGRTILNTEGTEIEDNRIYFLLKVEVSAFDEEGKYYKNSREFFGYKIDEILNENILREIKIFIDGFKEYVNAKEIKEYNGDIVLRGISSSKFILNLVKNRFLLNKENCEILKDFFDKIGNKITGDIRIYDKPDIKYFNGYPLSGHLIYDDEGVKSKEVILIEDGILKNFLLKREPVFNFKNSNGHARAGIYSIPFPFITNLFVDGKIYEIENDSILIIEDIEFKSSLSFEIKKGFLSYKNGIKKEIKNLIVSFSSFDEMLAKIKGVCGSLKSYNFYEDNPYMPFSINSYDLILKDVYSKRFFKKKIRSD